MRHNNMRDLPRAHTRRHRDLVLTNDTKELQKLPVADRIHIRRVGAHASVIACRPWDKAPLVVPGMLYVAESIPAHLRSNYSITAREKRGVGGLLLSPRRHHEHSLAPPACVSRIRMRSMWPGNRSVGSSAF